MVEAEGVTAKFQIDDREVKLKWAEFERIMRRAQDMGNQGGKAAGRGISGFASAAIGGAAGFVAGALFDNPATASITDLVISMVAAALLPVLMEIAGWLEKFWPIIEKAGQWLAQLLGASADAIGAVAGVVGDIWGGKTPEKISWAEWVAGIGSVTTATGAIAGSIIPGAGTAVGAGVGALIGASVGTGFWIGQEISDPNSSMGQSMAGAAPPIQPIAPQLFRPNILGPILLG